MCVLNNCRYTCAAAPVVVQVCVLVREQLHLVRSQAVGVVNDLKRNKKDLMRVALKVDRVNSRCSSLERQCPDELID